MIVSVQEKSTRIFQVFDIANYLRARHTLYLALWIFDVTSSGDCFLVSFLRTWDIELNAKKKLHTSALPSIILFLTSISYQRNNDFMKRAIQTSSISLFYIM